MSAKKLCPATVFQIKDIAMLIGMSMDDDIDINLFLSFATDPYGIVDKDPFEIMNRHYDHPLVALLRRFSVVKWLYT